MEYFIKFYNSLWNYKWLATQKNEAKKNWQYFLFLCLFFAFLSVLPTLWSMPKAMEQGKDYFNKNVPDFALQIKDGNLTVDKLEQPFVREFTEGDNQRTMLVVDTISTSTLDAKSFAKSDTDNVVLFTRENMVLRTGQNNKTEMQDFKKFPNGNWDRAMVMGWFDKLRGGWLYAFTGLLFVFMFITTLAEEIIYIAFMSLLIWLITRIAKRGWSYSQVFYVGLLVVTLPLVLRLISVYVGVQVPALNSAVYWLLALLAIFWQRPVATDVLKVDGVVEE